MAKSISLMMELLKRKPTCRKVHLPYKTKNDYKLRIKDEDKDKLQALMSVVHEVLGKAAFDIHLSSANLIRVSAFMLGNLKFDIKASTKDLMKAAEQSGIKSSRGKLIKTLESESN